MDAAPWLDRAPAVRFDLFAASQVDLDGQQMGAYVFHATKAWDIDPSLPWQFSYPLGACEAFYIGQTTTLKKRFRGPSGHFLEATAAREEFQQDKRFTTARYMPAYYAAVFGAQVLWFPCGPQEHPSTLERSFMKQFFDRFGAIPAANMSWPWNETKAEKAFKTGLGAIPVAKVFEVEVGSLQVKVVDKKVHLGNLRP